MTELWVTSIVVGSGVLDAVYVDVRQAGAPITIKPKAAFEAALAATPALAL